jgi:hypothetical protein
VPFVKATPINCLQSNTETLKIANNEKGLKFCPKQNMHVVQMAPLLMKVGKLTPPYNG